MAMKQHGMAKTFITTAEYTSGSGKGFIGSAWGGLTDFCEARLTLNRNLRLWRVRNHVSRTLISRF